MLLAVKFCCEWSDSSSQNFTLCLESRKELSPPLSCLQFGRYGPISQPYFTLQTYSKRHLAHHMMVIQLVYWYHMISLIIVDYSGKTKQKDSALCSR